MRDPVKFIMESRAEAARRVPKLPSLPDGWVKPFEVRGSASGQAVLYAGEKPVLKNLSRPVATFLADLLEASY